MKKWTSTELNKCINLLKEGKTYKEISLIVGRTSKSIKVKLNKNGYKFNNYKKSFFEIVRCLNCDIEFKSLISENRKFCSHSCSATYNNKLKIKRNTKNRKNYHKRKKRICLNCGKITTNKYCNSKCQNDYRRNEIFKKIEAGDTTLNHKQYKKYLTHKYGEKCMECGWCEIHPITGNVPIEMEHIDGNSENNSLDNLKLLCPNCHSLTPTYKSLNIGNGRHKRMKRYYNKKSY
ncbi:MAG: HNH endonuclease signature motif containing protein [bacterium]